MSENSITQSIIQFEIHKCQIYSTHSQGFVDVRHILVELNLFEDMFSNCMSGNVLISDSVGLINRDFWSGEEFLVLEIQRRGDEGSAIKKIFKIYSITDRKKSNKTNESYILNFCSEELLLAEKLRINKTYKESLISDIVKDIVLNYLKIDPNEFTDDHIDKTDGKFNITIPNLKPFQAINWLCNLATQNGRRETANYLFWQTKEGYFFKPFINIFGNRQKYYYKGMSKGGFYWFGISNLDLNSKIGRELDISRDKTSDDQQILSYKTLDTYDTLDALRKGAFSNKSIGLDIVARNIYEHNFNYESYHKYLNENIELYKKEGKFPLTSFVEDRFGKSDNQYNESVVKVHFTTTKRNREEFVKKNEKKVFDYNLEMNSPYRTAQFALLSYNRLSLTVPGDPNLSVGKLIKVIIPQNTVSKNLQPDDFLISGFYIITALRHIINKAGEYYTSLEIRKDSFYSISSSTEPGNGIPKSSNNDKTLKELTKKNSF